jgi:hypothetical protein
VVELFLTTGVLMKKAYIQNANNAPFFNAPGGSRMDAYTLSDELLDQYLLAGSEKTQPEQLRVLAEHNWVNIRIHVAENTNTPIDVLRNLSCDKDIGVRAAVAKNPEFSQEISQCFEYDTGPANLNDEATDFLSAISNFFHNF